MIMSKVNKLLVNSSIDINNSINDISTNSSNITINVFGNSLVYIVNQNINELIINMEDNSTLDTYIYNICNLNNIEINQHNNSNINFNYSFINESDNLLKINNNIDGNNNKSNILVKNISNKGISNIDVKAYINKNTIDNELNENIKGIITNGLIEVDPVIVCDSNEVNALHSATISGIDMDSINYLMSKGLSNSSSTRLILDGFIVSNMDEYIKEFYI